MKNQKTSVLLGQLTPRLVRGRNHNKRISLLISKLNERVIKRGGIVPKIFKEEELVDRDRIVVEGENSWNEAMAQYIATNFTDANVEQLDNRRVEIYVPVHNEGIITSSPTTDVLANLSVIALCLFLLYLFMYQ